MRIILSLALIIMFFSCKNEKKDEVKIAEPVEVENNLDFPKLENIPTNVNYVFSEGYLFSEKIQIEEIASFKDEKDSHSFIIYLNDNTDFEELKKLTLGIALYPKDISVLKTEKEKKKKYRSSGFSTNVFLLDNSPVLHVKNFAMATSEIKLLKVYFYSKEAGVLNNKTLKISNIEL